MARKKIPGLAQTLVFTLLIVLLLLHSMPGGAKRKGVAQRLPCLFPGCPITFKSTHGRSNHCNTKHVNTTSTSLPPPAFTPSPEPQSPGQDFGDADMPFRQSSASPLPSRSPGSPPQARGGKIFHKTMNAVPCDKEGITLPPNTPPSPRTTAADGDWSPFDDEVQFKTADFLFRRVEMSKDNIDYLLELWGLSLMKDGDLGPYDNYQQLYAAIDAVKAGDAPWKCFKTAPVDTGGAAPDWARQEYEIWYRDPDAVIRNMLDNPDFDGEFDTTPYVELDRDGQRHWSNFMSGNFAWKRCDQIIADDPTCTGAMHVTIILGADKTTVSVATGNIEYHPLYVSIGNVRNNVRRAHRNAVVPIGFLAIPKSERKYDNDAAFRTFKHQLYHASLSAILSTLKPGMTTPVIRRCPDGHFRRVIYDLGPFIADYPEQVLLAGIVQNWCPKCTAMSSNLDGPSGRRSHEHTDTLMDEFSPRTLWDEYGIDTDIIPFTYDFPRADIHELLSSDLLHQVIKGTFKDHLVSWVGDYLHIVHTPAEANSILDEIDRRIAATPHFPCLRRFKHGRRFKQWTGDDSKALMKIYLPAVKEFIPSEMVKAFSSFLDFCYLVRRPDFTEPGLDSVEAAIQRFHEHREIFRITGVRSGFSLPRQHSLVHYRRNIELFGAPGGLCSSITESRHITAVKKPWRRSSRYNALGQMLLTNQRLDKLAAARADFVEREMLDPTRMPPSDSDKHRDAEDDDGGEVDDGRVEGNVVLARRRERAYPTSLEGLATYIEVPSFPHLVRAFLRDQFDSDAGSESSRSSTSAESNIDTPFDSPISVFHSAIATFYSPSDPSGIWGMRRERIRSTPSWRKTGSRRDCAFVVDDQHADGFRAMSVVRVKLFFSFQHDGVHYPCALVEWYKKIGRRPDSDTGMWMVEPELRRTRAHQPLMTVVHLDSFLRGAHLVPVYGRRYLPSGFRNTWSLDVFQAFFVNKYIDAHANEIIF
ncbi:hypothetical protein B0H17DRAFT_1083378 [Mycena rosella]|uniref:C2H2-type domain-containing protein n=1 Tax=Mycena rosella TaxID=1033263 RepID=A0AAD7GAP8_MYCRO|nr:hypothetical protein B0H17DRAFT_1083378 [Mycena rosella]